MSFFLAFLIGEGLANAFGYPPGSDRWPPPPAVGIPATALAVLAFGLPAFASVWFARRAARAGDLRGWIPAAIGLVLFAGLAVLNVLPMGQ